MTVRKGKEVIATKMRVSNGAEHRKSHYMISHWNVFHVLYLLIDRLALEANEFKAFLAINDHVDEKNQKFKLTDSMNNRS